MSVTRMCRCRCAVPIVLLHTIRGILMALSIYVQMLSIPKCYFYKLLILYLSSNLFCSNAFIWHGKTFLNLLYEHYLLTKIVCHSILIQYYVIPSSDVSGGPSARHDGREPHQWGRSSSRRKRSPPTVARTGTVLPSFYTPSSWRTAAVAVSYGLVFFF